MIVVPVEVTEHETVNTHMSTAIAQETFQLAIDLFWSQKEKHGLNDREELGGLFLFVFGMMIRQGGIQLDPQAPLQESLSAVVAGYDFVDAAQRRYEEAKRNAN